MPHAEKLLINWWID